MKKTLLTLSIAFGVILGVNAESLTANAINLEGTYSCTGTDNATKPATRIDGKFSLKKQGYLYNLTQLDSQSNQPIKSQYDEVALQQGKILAISYKATDGSDSLGVEIMRVVSQKPIKLAGYLCQLD